MADTFTLSPDVAPDKILDEDSLRLSWYQGSNLANIVGDIKSRMQPGQSLTLVSDNYARNGREKQARREQFYALKKRLHQSFGDNGTKYYVGVGESEERISLVIMRRSQEGLAPRVIRVAKDSGSHDVYVAQAMNSMQGGRRI